MIVMSVLPSTALKSVSRAYSGVIAQKAPPVTPVQKQPATEAGEIAISHRRRSLTPAGAAGAIAEVNAMGTAASEKSTAINDIN